MSSCTHGFCVAPAPVQHCHAARAKIGYCHHGTRANLLGVSVVCGIRTGHFGSRTECLPDLHTSAEIFRHATRESVAQRRLGITGVGLFLLSNTRRTATLAGVSGPPVVTSPIMTIGLVTGRTTRPVVRRKKMRESPRLWLCLISRLWRTATRIMDEPLRTVQPTLRPRTPPGTLRRQRPRRTKL